MSHTLSGQSLLFLLLILGSCFNLATCEDDEMEDEAAADPGAETEAPPETEEETEQISAEHVVSDECANPKNETKQMCCKSFPEIDDSFIKCFMLHQKKMPKDTKASDLPLLVKFLSCLVECIYKSKKYIGKGDTLNMKMVKADLAKQYKSNKKKEQFMLDMYEHCERQGGITWRGMKKNLAARVIFTGACKPYLMFVFMCAMDYPVKVKCPYYVWKGTKDNEIACDRLREECEHK